MKLKTNYHTHTSRCLHAIGLDEDYVKKAISLGYTSIGFSDHAPYKDNRYSLRMQYNELYEYFDSINYLKEKYKDSIEILIGLEIEYDRNFLDYYKELLEKFDYLVLGQHVSVTEENPFINSFELEKTEDYLIYANFIKEALDTKLFSFLAHPDLIFINDFDFDENALKACNIITDAAKETNTPIELNCNGVRGGLKEYKDGVRFKYPHPKFWEIASSKNLNVLISTDAHKPDDLSDKSIDVLFDFANKLNLNIISKF